MLAQSRLPAYEVDVRQRDHRLPLTTVWATERGPQMRDQIGLVVDIQDSEIPSAPTLRWPTSSRRSARAPPQVAARRASSTLKP